jgi:hypothetical protein
MAGAAREFIVITPETLIVTPLAVDAHRVREPEEYSVRNVYGRRVNVESLARRHAGMDRLQAPGFEVLVRADEGGAPGGVEIRIEHRAESLDLDPLVRWVAPRVRVVRRPDGSPAAPGVGTFSIEVGAEIDGRRLALDSIFEWMQAGEQDAFLRMQSMDSLMMRLMQQGHGFSREQFDSLRREFERVKAPRQRR